MATATWNSEGIHKVTKTRFTPAGYDKNGFNERGFDRWGRDKDGFNAEGIDKGGNRRGSGLVGFETRVLRLAANRIGGIFRKTDLVPGFFRDGGKQGREWYFNHSEAFDSLVAKGYIARRAGRWCELTDKGIAKVAEIRKEDEKHENN